MTRGKDFFEEFIEKLEKIAESHQGKWHNHAEAWGEPNLEEYILEISQRDGGGSIKTESIILMPKTFNVNKPFALKITQNNEPFANNTAYSANITELFDEIIKKKGKK